MSTRRSFLQSAAGLAAAFSVAPSRLLSAPMKTMRIFIGTYTSGASKGIYTGLMDTGSGAISDVRLVGETEAPSFLATSPDQRFLYAVNELATFNGSPGGAVSAYAINGRTGDLRFLNQQPTRGAHPCHIITDRTGRWALVANYSGGNLTVLPIGLDGHLAAPATVVQHTGSSVNASRQEAPHAHSVHFDAKNRFVVAADLGLDKLMVYQWDARSGVLKPNEPAWLASAPGAGPRHFAWHPSGQYAFLINELNSTLSALSYDAGAGVFTERHTLSTLPEGFAGTNSCADVHVAPGGRFVYGSNRGHNSIAVFGFDAGAGQLTALAHTPTEGATPRNFGIAPGGRFLLAANQQSDTVVSFAIDRRSGLLSRVASAEVPTPVCIQFIED